jgi:hypothetical protein
MNLIIKIEPTSDQYPVLFEEYYQRMIKDYFKDNVREQWHMFNIDMGCSIFAKHDGTVQNEPIWIFMMHSDSWGQYGDDTSMVDKLVDFIPENYICDANCNEIEIFIKQRRLEKNSKKIKCPACRQESIVQLPPKLVKFQQLDNLVPKCIICYENDVSIMLEQCGHCIICKDCMLRL